MRIHRSAAILILSLALPGPSKAATELEEREAVHRTVQIALLNSDFRTLEQMSQKFREEKSRTLSGLWKLTLFYAGVDSAAKKFATLQPGSLSFDEFENRTAKWAEQYPGSATARISHSVVLLGHGWAFRGSGYADTVKPEAWAPFRKYVQLARDNLEKYKSVAVHDPRWYETMLEIARLQQWERREFDLLVKEALDREPLFYQTYFQALAYLLPKWHGDIGEIERFAQAAVKRTSKEEGTGMYARIYWYASQTQFDNDLFRDSMAVWPRMKAGFEDVIAKYPDAWNVNNYAKFACLAQDKAKTRELLPRIGSSVVLEAWQPASLLAKCADWASR
jgi:hypothetical protein